MSAFPKLPPLKSNGLRDPRELDEFINVWNGNVLLGQMLIIAALGITVMVLSEKLGAEKEKNRKK